MCFTSSLIFRQAKASFTFSSKELHLAHPEPKTELHPKNWTQFLEVQFFMSKYSKEVKEKAIYLSEKGWNSFSIAKELGIPESTVNGWLLKFKINHNINRKMVKRVFSADFKRKVIETRWKNKLSFKEVAEHFNLDNPSLIAAW